VTEDEAVPPRQLPEGFIADDAAGIRPDGWPRRIICERDDSPMVLIPAGPFVQGSDSGPPEAQPAHVIELDAYYIDVHEVTLGQWQKYRDAVKAEKKPTPAAAVNANGPAETPAVGVSWRDAMQYLKWAGKELPTEAEWEKAARGEQQNVYPWGNGRPIWESRRVPGQIDAVGSFRSDESVYGVKDMAGNAREWCDDWYAEDAYQLLASTAGVSVKNWPGPKTPDKAGRRVVKGGQNGWEVWNRSGLSMKDTAADVGFRGVLRIGGASTDGQSESDAAAEKPGDPAAPRKTVTPDRPGRQKTTRPPSSPRKPAF
jgi:formylglycine-generating enzyme required for sulfatase activity